ncbi:MarR family winged helix-turn-helix transcriptional regulator [Beduini massiliensis]|uniref:MarR family winged helix-turn-helix transcriptional regulator n=1 Tax=Beduini massiliensis TaxID=1585974 RepID=UPI00059A8D8E|nr:MarR family transcriptional regulator [Beduini massiliensis]
MVQIGKEVGNLSNHIKRTVDAKITAISSDLTGFQSRILHFIAFCGRDVYQRDIEEEFEIRRSSVTSVLQTMERNGLIERVSVEQDARLKKIILTTKAKELIRRIGEVIEEFEASLMEDLSIEEITVFMQVINKMMAKLND